MSDGGSPTESTAIEVVELTREEYLDLYRRASESLGRAVDTYIEFCDDVELKMQLLPRWKQEVAMPYWFVKRAGPKLTMEVPTFRG